MYGLGSGRRRTTEEIVVDCYRAGIRWRGKLADASDIAEKLQAREAEWRVLVGAASGALDSLAVVSDDGIAIGPIDTPANAPRIATRASGTAWLRIQTVDHPDVAQARERIEEEISGGADGVALVFAGSAAACRSGFGIETTNLGGIPVVGAAHLHVEAGMARYDDCRSFIGRARSLSLAFDPLAEAGFRGGFDRRPEDIADAIADMIGAMDTAGQDGAAFVADGRIWAAAGASEAQELSAMLGALAFCTETLLNKGVSIETLLRRAAIVLDAGPHQMLTIAKMRAARLLLARFVEAFGIAPTPLALHAETSWRALTREEPHINILRTTSAALAAGIGGADSITVLPFTLAHGLADSFARRVARNSQTILLEESGLARVADPAAGSGTIEALTSALAEKTWSIFRAHEAQGGLLELLRTGAFQNEIDTMRRARAKRIARREQKITGVSEFPSLKQPRIDPAARRSGTSLPAPAAETFPALRMERLSQPFETLRDRAEALAVRGSAPKVLMVDLGETPSVDAMQQARNFFAAGGIATVDTGLAAIGAQEGDVKAACLVGGTDDGILAASAALRAFGVGRLYRYGGRGPEDAIPLDENTDMVATLGDLLDLFT